MPNDPILCEPDSSEEHPLYDLLAEWERRRLIGPEPSPDELCPDDPVLRDVLRRKIAAQKKLDARLGLDEIATLEAERAISEHRPEIPGIVIEEEIGRGAMGVVYRGRQPALDRPVAVKVILGGAYAARPVRERFRTEAVATARIPHRNIVAVHDSGQSGGLPYLVLEYLSGGTLADRLRGEPQAPRWSAELVRTLADAVAAAHARNVVHRDLKPRNIVFAADGTPKITDYGLAKLLDDDPGLTATGLSPGTPDYMAPEQAGRKPHTVGPATDVYALGVILYQMLIGRSPFHGATISDTLQLVREQDPVAPSRLQPKTPRDLETICLKCLEKDPARRFTNAQALADDLGRFLDGRPIVARRTPPTERAWRWCRRNPGLSAALAALALITIGGFIGITWLWSVARTQRTTAEEHLDQVLRTLDRYTELARDPKPQSAELDPRRRHVLTEVQDELAALDRKYRGHPRIRRSLIYALIRVSQFEHDIGAKDRAVVSIGKAIERAETFVAEDPRSIDGRDLLVKALHWSLVVETDHERSIAAHRRADALLDLLIREQPGKAIGYRQLQCYNNYDFATRLLREGQGTEAGDLLRQTRDLAEILIRDPQPDRLMLRTMGRIYSYLGELEDQDRLTDISEASYRRSNELFRAVFEREPRNIEGLMEYALSCEQLQNFFGAHQKLEEATRFAREILRVLPKSDQGGGWHIEHWITIQKRLARADYMMELQHADNQNTLKGNPKQLAKEWDQLEAAARQVHAIGEAFRTLGIPDLELNYFDCMSCINIYFIFKERSKDTKEAADWLKRAHDLVPANIAGEADERRREHYRQIREIHDSVMKKAN